MVSLTVAEFEKSFRELSEAEKVTVETLIEEASIIIDSLHSKSDEDTENVVACRMIRRAMTAGDLFPTGATQGSMSAGGYTQSWTIGSNGSSGELYVSKLEKKLLGVGERVGSYSPLEACDD